MLISKPEEYSMANPKKIASTKKIKDIASSDKLEDFLDSKRFEDFISIELNQTSPEGKTIAFVCSELPHLCELWLWSETLKKLNRDGIIYTQKSEANAFDFFHAHLEYANKTTTLKCVLLESIAEEPTFLANMEPELTKHQIILCVGEKSLSSFQALKAKSQMRSKIILWQNAPRPYQTIKHDSNILPKTRREMTIRQEVIDKSDLVIALDKDSAAWSYLEGVNAQRLRRLSRAIDFSYFNPTNSAKQKNFLRTQLGLTEHDYIFLHLGSLELESGALDALYAFRYLKESQPELAQKAKIVFCGQGQAATQIRQTAHKLNLNNDTFFISHENALGALKGDRLAHLVTIANTVLHLPLSPVNAEPERHFDSTYDVLCSLSYGISVLSNGHGWVGELVSRFYKTVSQGSIFNLARQMEENISQEQNKNKETILKTLENEFSLERSTTELAKEIKRIERDQSHMGDNIRHVLDSAEKRIQAKQYVEAIDTLSLLLTEKTISPHETALVFRLLGDGFTKLGDYQSGQQNYLRALEFDPYQPKVYIGLGTVALQLQNFHASIPHFQKAVSLAPKNDMASLGLGLAFEAVGEKAEAIKWTVRACELNVANTTALYELVKLCYDVDEYTQAENVLHNYVAQYPHDTQMIFALGGILYKLEKYEEATEIMENILNLDPQNVQALTLLKEMSRIEKRKHA